MQPRGQTLDLKDQLAQFIGKLWDILKKKEFQSFICWSNDGTQVLIKSPKKVEQKVLPHYFRHRKLSSFIRQMNMYGFTKVNKLSKEKSHMYFKNNDFNLQQPQKMKLIRRKKGRHSDETSDIELPSIEQKVSNQEESFNAQKMGIIYAFGQIQNMLSNIAKQHPRVESELAPALEICQSMTKVQFNTPAFKQQVSIGQSIIGDQNFNYVPMNSVSQFLAPEGDVPKQVGQQLNSFILPSLGSFGNL